MTLHTPVYMQPASGDPDVTYSAQELRQLMRNVIGGLQALDVQGVVSSAAFKVTQRGAGANFSVDVAAGGAFVVGDDVASQGTYFEWNDGTFNVATPSAPASGTRVHRLVLQIQDKLNNGVWTGYSAAFTVLQDTGSGTPAEPNSALTLALISISAGQASVLNANITDQRPIIGPDSTWIDPAMGSGWHNNSTIPNDDNIQVKRLTQSNAVAMRGSFSRSGGSWSNGSVVFTLPAGYYNTTTYKYVPVGWGVDSSSGPAANGSLRINGSGQAQIYVSGSGAGVNGNVFAVSGDYYLN